MKDFYWAILGTVVFNVLVGYLILSYYGIIKQNQVEQYGMVIPSFFKIKRYKKHVNVLVKTKHIEKHLSNCILNKGYSEEAVLLGRSNNLLQSEKDRNLFKSIHTALACYHKYPINEKLVRYDGVTAIAYNELFEMFKIISNKFDYHKCMDTLADMSLKYDDYVKLINNTNYNYYVKIFLREVSDSIKNGTTLRHPLLFLYVHQDINMNVDAPKMLTETFKHVVTAYSLISGIPIPRCYLSDDTTIPTTIFAVCVVSNDLRDINQDPVITKKEPNHLSVVK